MAVPGDLSGYDYVKVRLNSASKFIAVTDTTGQRVLAVITLDYAGGTKRMQLRCDGEPIEKSPLAEM